MPYTFTDPDTGATLQADVEQWRWKALYENNITLLQFNDANMRFHRFAEIDQSRLKRFILFSPAHKQQYVLDFDPSYMKLVHFYRTSDLFIDTGPGEGFRHVERCYHFGYEDTRDHSKHLIGVDQQGNVILSDTDEMWLRDKALRQHQERMAA